MTSATSSRILLSPQVFNQPSPRLSLSTIHLSHNPLSFFMNIIHVILHPEKRKELHTRKSPSFHRPEHNLRLPRYAPTTLASHTESNHATNRRRIESQREREGRSERAIINIVGDHRNFRSIWQTLIGSLAW